jgi:hypothetical protein
MKDKILWVLAFIWTNIIPLLIALAFCVGVFYNLWDVQKLPMWISLLITIVGGSGLVYGFGKLLKKW